MKKNIVLLAAAAAFLAAACNPIEETYVPGLPTGENDNVFFSPDNASSVVLPVDGTTFDVVVCREKTDGALTLPLEAWTNGPFEIPESVAFAAGEAEATVTITAGTDMEMFKNYDVRLSVSDEYTHAYDTLYVYPRATISVVKEDYKPYANGQYLDYFFSGQGWDITMEYSEILKMYRLSDVWAPLGTGSTTDLTFAWDGTETVVMGASSYSTGVAMSDYGNVTAVVEDGSVWYGIPAGMLAEEALDGFVFDFKWTVAAGSFGTGYPQFYIITEKL